MTPTSTLQLACPTCGDEIEVEYEIHCVDCRTEPISLRTYCFCPLSRAQAYDLLMNEGARQAELATERAGGAVVTRVEVRATMRVTVDVAAIKREIEKSDPWPSDPEPQGRTDREIAEDYVNGEAGATIDNHITIQEITTIENVAEEASLGHPELHNYGERRPYG